MADQFLQTDESDVQRRGGNESGEMHAGRPTGTFFSKSSLSLSLSLSLSHPEQDRHVWDKDERCFGSPVGKKDIAT